MLLAHEQLDKTAVKDIPANDLLGTFSDEDLALATYDRLIDSVRQHLWQSCPRKLVLVLTFSTFLLGRRAFFFSYIYSSLLPLF
jgi:hypothetical protein